MVTYFSVTFFKKVLTDSVNENFYYQARREYIITEATPSNVESMTLVESVAEQLTNEDDYSPEG